MKPDFRTFAAWKKTDKNKKDMNQQYPSVLLEKAVDEFAKLPGIGRKKAEAIWNALKNL